MSAAEEQMDVDIVDDTEEVLRAKIKKMEEELEAKKRLVSAANKERVELEEKIEHTVTCPVCYVQYDNGEHSPRFTPCHTLCDSCLSKLLETARDAIRRAKGLEIRSRPTVIIKCPVCQIRVRCFKGLTELDSTVNKAIQDNINFLTN